MDKVTIERKNIKALGIDISGAPRVLLNDNIEIIILKGDYEDILSSCLLSACFMPWKHEHYLELYHRTREEETETIKAN